MTMNRWWRDAVIYQIYPRSFMDTDGNGVGDLPGIVDKLDYIASLGVDAIWISPFFKSPMHDFGYDISDYCDVDPLFGTLDDFDRLLRDAHARGLKVVVLANTYAGFSGTLVLSKSVVDKLGVSPTAPIAQRLKALDGLVIGSPSATGAYTVTARAAAAASELHPASLNRERFVIEVMGSPG